MRGALIDDVTLAGRVKKSGRIWLGHSRLATSIRPYETAGDVWRMVARCAYVQLGYSPWKLAGTVAGMAVVWWRRWHCRCSATVWRSCSVPRLGRR